MDELKPCPFCGSESIEIEPVLDEYTTEQIGEKVKIVCYHCFVECGEFYTTAEAIRKWNRRAADGAK